MVKFYNEKVARDLITTYLGGDMRIYDKYEAMFSNLKSKYSDSEVALIESMWDEVWGHRELMYDPIHPSAEGYKIIADNIFNEAKDYLASKGFVKDIDKQNVKRLKM
jgi:lysophospholipase L1-like esterase